MEELKNQMLEQIQLNIYPIKGDDDTKAAEKCAEIAESLAVEFAEYCEANYLQPPEREDDLWQTWEDNHDGKTDKYYTTKELFKIFIEQYKP